MTEELNQEESTLDSQPSEAAPDNQEVETPKSKVDKRFSTLTSQLYHKDDLLRQKEDELATLRDKLEGQSKPVDVPPPPERDLLDDNPDEYYRQLDARNEALAEKKFQSLEASRAEMQTRRKTEEQATQRQQQQQEIAMKYIEGGLQSGISEAKMQANEAVLRSANLSADLAEHIYSDENGAKLVDFLVDNPDQLQKITGMSPLQASIAIANDIKPQALSTKPTTTNAPDPIQPTRGMGTPPADDWVSRHPSAVFD